ncbi:unnamed protein product [Orchesella dallaii]|uniref:Uncharacterized protein n=1 Tax=Orchesella dallaii TaxID=48710 RepID=A0ABP1S467_9HEXA
MAKFAPIVIVVLAAILIDIAVVAGFGYYPGGSASTATGGVGGQYTGSEGAHETHNDKDFAIKYGSKQGSSSSFKNTGAQAGAHGATAHVQQPYYQYPVYPQYGWDPTPPTHGWGPTPPPHGWGPAPPPPPPPTQGWGPPPPTQGWGPPPTHPPPTLPTPKPTPGWLRG